MKIVDMTFREIRDELEKDNLTPFITGGYIRDMVYCPDKTPNDMDIVVPCTWLTDAEAFEVAEQLCRHFGYIGGYYCCIMQAYGQSSNSDFNARVSVLLKITDRMFNKQYDVLFYRANNIIEAVTCFDANINMCYLEDNEVVWCNPEGKQPDVIDILRTIRPTRLEHLKEISERIGISMSPVEDSMIDENS